MQKQLITNNFVMAFFLGFALLSSSCQAVEEKKVAKEISVNTFKHPASFSLDGSQLKLDKKLDSDFFLVDSAFVLNEIPFELNAGKYFWLVAKLPSKPRSLGKGYCGAGTEDYLYLIGYGDAKLVYVDRLLVRSCLNNVEVGYGEDLEKEQFTFEQENGTVKFRQRRINESKTYVDELTLTPTPQTILRSTIRLKDAD
ncbi:MAG: hypothetical protein IV085_07935 [Thiobacillus sp.]|nr:hypothetical protein [Thiobacillus sp.]